MLIFLFQNNKESLQTQLTALNSTVNDKTKETVGEKGGKDELKERSSKRSRKKEKEKEVSQKAMDVDTKKRLLGLPFEASVIGIVLLVVLGSLYVVCSAL